MGKFFKERGFTLIELAAVVGVIAVTSAILLVNNRLNELQLSLSNSSAGVASAVSRAKALTLQNLDDTICGYGVHFIPGVIGTNSGKAVYEIFKDAKVNGACDRDGRVYTDSDVLVEGGKVELGSGLTFLSPSNISSSNSNFIQNVVFYSSDAKVKLTGFNGQDILPAGVVVVATNSMPTSFITLKITTTGQVTSKNGAYINAGDFDSEMQSQLNYAGGQFTVTGTEQNNQQNNQQPGGLNPGNESCIADCSCAAHLASGQSCSDGCGGTCYAGSGGDPGCRPNPVNICDNKTCADFDNCGAPCVACGSGFSCVNKQCVVCAPSCAGKVCGDDNGCGGVCTTCPAGQACANLIDNSYQCIPAGVQLRITDIEPAQGVK